MFCSFHPCPCSRVFCSLHKQETDLNCCKSEHEDQLSLASTAAICGAACIFMHSKCTANSPREAVCLPPWVVWHDKQCQGTVSHGVRNPCSNNTLVWAGIRRHDSYTKMTRCMVFRQQMKAGEATEESETLPAWRPEMERIFLDVRGFPGLFLGSKIKQFLFIFKGKGWNTWRCSILFSQTEGGSYIKVLPSPVNVQ